MSGDPISHLPPAPKAATWLLRQKLPPSDQTYFQIPDQAVTYPLMSSSSSNHRTCGDPPAASLPAELNFDLDGALDAADYFSRAGAGAGPLVSAMPATEGAGVCAVCMEEYGPTEGRRTPCSHVYHAGCISEWLAIEASCPLCRSMIGV